MMLKKSMVAVSDGALTVVVKVRLAHGRSL